jgi:hypothetical protein
MVNSHLTWLVEFGWIARWMYLLGWIGVLAFLWPETTSGVDSQKIVAFAIWISFGILAFFSSVAEEWTLWIIPVVFLVWSVLRFIRRKNHIRLNRILWAAIASTLLCVSLLVVGLLSSPSYPVRGSRKSVIIGQGTPDIWVVADPAMVGRNYGKTLRQTFPEWNHATTGIVSSIADIGNVENKTVVFFCPMRHDDGKALQSITDKATMVYLVNPETTPHQLFSDSGQPGNLWVAFGDFSQRASIYEWRRFMKTSLLIIPGAGDFIGDWANVITTQFNIFKNDNRNQTDET